MIKCVARDFVSISKPLPLGVENLNLRNLALPKSVVLPKHCYGASLSKRRERQANYSPHIDQRFLRVTCHMTSLRHFQATMHPAWPLACFALISVDLYKTPVDVAHFNQYSIYWAFVNGVLYAFI